MTMQVSAACFSFPLLTLEQATRVLATIGFQHADVGMFEFMNGEPMRPNIPIAHLLAAPELVAGRLNRISAENDIGFSDLFYEGRDFYDTAVNHPDAAVRRSNQVWFNALVRLCNEAHIPGITLLPGMVWPELGPERSFELAQKELSGFGVIAAEHGLRLSVEPHIDSVIEPFDLAVRLVQETPGLKLTLDYTHFVAKGIPVERIHALAPYAGHFHARQAAPGRLQCSRSEGTINYAEIVRKLHESGYSGFLTIEYVWMEWQRCNLADVVSESILLRDELQRTLAEMR